MMDLLQRLGGRKFLMALIVLGIGTYIEIAKAGGLSQNMVALMIGLVGVFSAANHATSAAFMKSKAAGGSTRDDVSDKINAIYQAAAQAQDPNNPSNKQLRDLLASINKGVMQVQDTTIQVGNSVVNIGKEVGRIKVAVAQPDNFR